MLIVLTDSRIKTLCYMRSCGVNFENSEIFRFLRGPKGGFPPKNFKVSNVDECRCNLDVTWLHLRCNLYELRCNLDMLNES